MFNKKINKTILVDNMSCAHCTEKVRKNLEQIPNVSKVKVNLDKKEVVITSKEPIDLNQVKNIIESLDYKYIGEKE